MIDNNNNVEKYIKRYVVEYYLFSKKTKDRHSDIDYLKTSEIIVKINWIDYYTYYEDLTEEEYLEYEIQDEVKNVFGNSKYGYEIIDYHEI